MHNKKGSWFKGSSTKCLATGTICTMAITVVPTIENSPAVPEQIIKSRQLCILLLKQSLIMRSEKEAIHLILTGLDKYTQLLMHVRTAQEMWGRHRRLQQESHCTTNKIQSKEIAKPITTPSESASEEDSEPEQAQMEVLLRKSTNPPTTTSELPQTPETRMWILLQGGQVVQQSGIQYFNYKEFGHYAKECRNPKRVKDSTYHKEKMLLCKQAKKGLINLNFPMADDDEYTVIYRKPKAITPNLPIEEPDNSLSMGDEHLNTTPEMKKSSVENIPSGFKDSSIKSPKIDFLPEEFADELDFIDPILPGIDEEDCDEDDFDEEEGEIDDDILQIEDEILREKLLNVNLLVRNKEIIYL
ncbi:retrovirus-related pol polyprotein from transposon TNT 1-94 [Tanacetum coccineum]